MAFSAVLVGLIPPWLFPSTTSYPDRPPAFPKIIFQRSCCLDKPCLSSHQCFGSLDRIITINQLNNSNSSSWFAGDRSSPGGKTPYIHKSEQIDLVLGFQDTFWSSTNKRKYWGVTTVEHWGKTNNRGSKLLELDYTNSAPILDVGSSSLTFSGGGNENPIEKNHSRSS